MAIVRCSVCHSMPGSTCSLNSTCFQLFLWSLVVTLAMTFSGCGGPWRDAYLKKGVGRLTQEDIRERLGPPHTAKTPALGGDSLWTYRFPLSDQDLTSWRSSMLGDASNSITSMMGKGADTAKPTLYCYRYTLTFSEDKILKTWNRAECVPGTRETLTAK